VCLYFHVLINNLYCIYAQAFFVGFVKDAKIERFEMLVEEGSIHIKMV
jgi:hypothetical protein